MDKAYLLFFLCLPLFAWSSPQIKVLPNPQSLEDFDHPNKGCPENSECDVVMGLQMQRWKELVTKLKKDSGGSAKEAQLLEMFREKFGIPAEFYTTSKSQQGFKPFFFNSPCKEHNPAAGEKILKGSAFIKKMGTEKATVWRDQAEMEIPLGPLLIPQPVKVYTEPVVKFNLPLTDQPLFIKEGDLFVLKEEDDLFYMLRITAKGSWKIENVDFSQLSTWENKREEVKCPPDLDVPDPKLFGLHFCKSVWDETNKKAVIVRMHQGCVI